MKNFLICFTATFVTLTQLTACDTGINGQIEKCVQSAITVNAPYKNNAEKSETELQARVFCLRAASGKD